MSDSTSKKITILSHLKNNIPESPAQLYQILYTFKFEDSDMKDIIDIFCNYYDNDLDVANKMLIEYREYARGKQRTEMLEQKEADRLEALEDLRLEMASVSNNPEQFKKLDIEKYVGLWQQKVKPSAPIPKIVDFMECEPVAIEIALSIGYIQIPKGITCCVHAPGGAGKSILMQRVIMASGIKACYISGEDSAGMMANMLQPYRYRYTCNNADFVHFDNQNIDGVIEFIEYSEYQMYIIDPLSSFCTGDHWGRVETENGVASELLRIFNGITAKSGKTIIYTHHEAKSSNDIRTAARGSSALIDNARMGISINRLSERYRKPHSAKKNKYEEAEEHTSRVKSFQRALSRSLAKQPQKIFRNQEMIGVVEMIVHKNNYGQVGDKADFILTANMGRPGLNVVPAKDLQPEIREAVNESFIQGEY